MNGAAIAFRMQFLSDNAASVHPRVWAAMQAADSADSPYDGDALSRRLDEAFGALFGREVAVLWVATGTAAWSATAKRISRWTSAARRASTSTAPS